MSAKAHSQTRTAAGWMAPVALLLAVIAVAVTVWSAVHAPTTSTAVTAPPTSTAPPSPVNPEQVAQSTSEVCAAFNTVRNAVSLQTNNDLGSEPVAVTAVAANARLATLGGGQYLLGKLTPAVPADLSDAVRAFANGLQEIGMQQLAGAVGDDPQQVDRMNQAQSNAARITELCK